MFGHGGGVTAVRLEQRGPGVLAVVLAVRGIHQDLQSRARGQPDHLLAHRRRQRALAIVLQANEICPVKGRTIRLDDLPADILGQRVGILCVNPHELLFVPVLGKADEPLFGHRRSVTDLGEARNIRPERGQMLPERIAVCVPTEHTDTNRDGPKRGDVGCHGTGATTPGIPFPSLSGRERGLPG